MRQQAGPEGGKKERFEHEPDLMEQQHQDGKEG